MSVVVQVGGGGAWNSVWCDHDQRGERWEGLGRAGYTETVNRYLIKISCHSGRQNSIALTKSQ